MGTGGGDVRRLRELRDARVAEVVLGRGGVGGARAARREARREERAEVLEARALAAARRGAAVEAGLPPPELVDERALAVALVRVELGVAREVRQEPRGRGGRRAARVLGAHAVGGRARDAAEAVQVVEARLLGERGLLVRVRLAPEAPHVGLGGRRDGVVRAALGLERAARGGEAGARLAQGRDARRELGLARAERPRGRARAARRGLELAGLGRVARLLPAGRRREARARAPVAAHAPCPLEPVQEPVQGARAAPQHALGAVRDDELAAQRPQPLLLGLVVARRPPQPLAEAPRVRPAAAAAAVRGRAPRGRERAARGLEGDLEAVDGRALLRQAPRHDLRRRAEGPERRVAARLARVAAPRAQLLDARLEAAHAPLEFVRVRALRRRRRRGAPRRLRRAGLALERRDVAPRDVDELVRRARRADPGAQAPEPRLAQGPRGLGAPRGVALPRRRLAEPRVLVLRQPQAPRRRQEPVEVGHVGAAPAERLDLRLELRALGLELARLGAERAGVAPGRRGPRGDEGPVGVAEVALERPVVLPDLAERRLLQEVRRHVRGREEARDVGARPVALEVAEEPVQGRVDRRRRAGRGAGGPRAPRAVVLLPEGRVLQEAQEVGGPVGARPGSPISDVAAQARVELGEDVEEQLEQLAGGLLVEVDEGQVEAEAVVEPRHDEDLGVRHRFGCLRGRY